MKNIILKILILSTIGVFMSCQDEDKFNSPATHELTKGGFVRFAEEIPVMDFDVSETLDNAIFTTTLEDPTDNVASYTLNLVSNIGGVERESMEYTTITSFPANLTITPDDFASFYNIPISDLGVGDFFTFEATVTTKDGNTYTSEKQDFDNDSLEISGGRTEANLIAEEAYRQAFTFLISYACSIAEPFTGEYLIEQTTAELDGPALSSGTVVEVTAPTPTIRAFETLNYPAYINDCGAIATFRFSLICGEVKIPSQTSNCNCSSGAEYFTAPDVNATYDEFDDSEFFITFTENKLGDCGGTPGQTTYKFTKQ